MQKISIESRVDSVVKQLVSFNRLVLILKRIFMHEVSVCIVGLLHYFVLLSDLVLTGGDHYEFYSCVSLHTL